ncbi:MATE family efflux transporter [Butyrivibrio sp. INlla16]|uniref:MATE family efflux transporter n=1 Tax=Butyrivibrio sp. INlla16 TaxID=1520807 RepID=UPI00088A4721|nr:MATE family efflux transporter [Butyrivibrio sp. INlla16]SDB57240.1 putative efflux protein, MATE family [Butyrivibrio sp. INlla16]
MAITKTMTEGAPWKHILKFSLPVLAGSLLQQLYNTVDTIIVGNFSGQDALSAVGTTGSFAFLFLAIAIGFSAGNGVVVAQHYGAKDEKRVRENAATGILFLMVLGLLSAVIGIIVARPAFTYLLNVDRSIIGLTLVYFRWYCLGLLFQFGYNIFSSILRAVGDSAATLYFLLISSVLNIGLDVLFVAVFKWGVAGAAVATDISQLASFMAAYYYMKKKYPVFRFKLGDYKWDSERIAATVRIGFPISLQLIIVSFGLTFIQRAVNGFGKVMTASFTVGQRIEMYLNLPCNALQTTLATYTGQNIGAGKKDRIKIGVRQAFIISLLMTLCISAMVSIFADKLILLFGLDEQATVYCLAHLRAVAMINIVLSMYIPLFGVFQGTGHSGIPTIVATCALGIRVIVVYVFRYSSIFGHTIIWWNGIFGFGLGFMITWSYYLSGKWKNTRFSR